MFDVCVHVPTLHCMCSELSPEWQPPVGKKKAGNVGEARHTAAASRSLGGGGSVMYWQLPVRSRRIVSKSGMGLPRDKEARCLT